VAEPFEKGYALTVGNSLRRTLLSIVPGRGVSWVQDRRRAERRHEGSGRDREPCDVLLNLKKLAMQVPSTSRASLRMESTGPKEVKGEDVPETVSRS
jgi:DNA-directed RNA polymerase subunit alpha